MTAILLDIDGVLHVSGEPVPGAPEAVQALRDKGHRLRFVTNNTTRARGVLAGELQGIGFDLGSDDITTTPLAAGKFLQGKRVLALTMSSIRDDLAGYVELVDDGADAVLLGGADETEETGEIFSYDRLNQAYAEVREGARLVCLHKNKWWQTSRGPLLDAGAFVAGLEYAAGVEAEVDATPAEAVMVGDDVDADIGGAKAIGMRGVLVRTGKFRPAALREAEPQPDAVVDSIADLPAYLNGA
jgi:HAD superfamily hydrolase (TIGR01458 family)